MRMSIDIRQLQAHHYHGSSDRRTKLLEIQVEADKIRVCIKHTHSLDRSKVQCVVIILIFQTLVQIYHMQYIGFHKMMRF